jgi:nicotinamide-nucleotide amidase
VSDLAAILTAVHARLRERGETVGTIESLTGGLLAAELTITPGASLTFRGGLVVYATDLKASLAGVDPETLAEVGPVAEWTARELAVQGRARLDSDWAVSTTGVAGPDPQDGVAVGTVYVGICGPSGAKVCELSLAGDRNTIRRRSVVESVLFLAREIGA